MVTREESEIAANSLPNGKFMLLENTPHQVDKADVEMMMKFIAQ